MIPVRLELTAFGPFVETQVVDFERLGAHGLFLIHGQTGAGKSSLLDALTFALFGDTSGGGRDGEDMVTSLAAGRSTAVALEFNHAGRRYRVERSPRHLRAKKRGEGFTSVAPLAHLYELPGGAASPAASDLRSAREPRLLAEGKDAVTAAIKELLHCDAKQFRQTVVLPQGQFRQVIEDDATRRSTLSQLFDTGRFKRLQERMSAYAKHLRSAVADAEASLEELRTARQVPDLAGLEAKLTAALAGLAAAEGADEAAAGALKLAIEAHTAGKRLHADFTALAATRVELSRLADRAQEVEVWRRHLADDSRARDAEPAVAAWRHAVTEAEGRSQALERAEVDLAEAGRQRADATELQAEHESGRPRREAADATAKRLELLAPDLQRYATARAESEAASQAAAFAGQAEAKAKESFDQLGESRSQTETATVSKEAELEALGDTGASLAAASALAKAARSVHEALRTLGELGSTDTDIDLAGLWLPLSRALAARLEPGEPCPVCGATDHPGHEHGAAGAGPSAGPDARLAARSDSRSAATPSTSAVAELESALKAAQEGRVALAAHRAAAEERLRAGLAAGGWADAAEVPSPAETTAKLEAAEAAQRSAQQLATDLRKLRTEREQLATRSEAAAKAYAEAAAKLHSAEVGRATAQTKLGDLAERLEPRYREDPASFALDLDAARAVVAAFDERARSLAEATAAAERALAAASEKLRLAQDEAKTSATAADKAHAVAEKALRRHGFLNEAGAPDPDAQAAALLDPDRRAELSDEVRRHDEALIATKAREEQLLANTEGRIEPDLGTLQRAEDEATTARNAAAEAAETARRLRDALQSDGERWRSLETALGATRDRHRSAERLADLTNGKVTGQFRLDLETYVLRRILTDVLLLANRHLAGMTGGRFQLRLNESEDELRASGLRLDVEDRHAGGRRRRVATLSGGEGFQASLALALGLAETAQRTSGAVEIGALFVDEGFGSLDSATLEEVVTILRRLPGDQHRMVGVITHVEALKGRITAQLEVVGSADGSGSSVRHAFG